MANKTVGFDLSLLNDTYGDTYLIKSVQTFDQYLNIQPFEFDPMPSYYELGTIVNLPNSGAIVEANLPGEDGDVWLSQIIVDFEETPPNQIQMVIVDSNDNEHFITSVDFIGGYPYLPHSSPKCRFLTCNKVLTENAYNA